MEAEEKPQDRAKAKPCKAGVSGRTCSSTRRPISSRDMTVLRTGAAGKPFILTQGDLFGSTKVEVLKEATTTTPCPRRSRISS